ncbi:5-methyltetrahydrofolate--homocysteine methyltransferase [Geosporobacter subterraneus DSM 17957]|uniref:5-methyltetrahydrofolate--homocysteine methyltransferase n=1 Tax=Geosporobacter subterraneus DSM 17957 TaxID=1121919 RepID=A0A1M6NL43_9FIRM|nr:corrinoid protein [Geosporobacter subterraneus]SHJ96441.1 5-methyltetrahydrofolate--homocysteine methyltransferase [Geosporobacter subterraneus DSM 17957]
MEVLQTISEVLQRGNAKLVGEKTQEALDQGLSPAEILNDGLLAGMAVIGKKFKNNEVYVPEVLIAARAMHAGLNVLQPKLVESGTKPVGTVVLGTVKGDVHDIGKNLVGMMMVGAGLEVIDIGIDVSKEKFIEAIQTHKPKILALSALLTTTMPELKTVIDAVTKAGLRDQVKIMVGGAPVNAEFAKEIGADGYSPDAGSAAEMAKQFALA